MPGPVGLSRANARNVRFTNAKLSLLVNGIIITGGQQFPIFISGSILSGQVVTNNEFI